MHRITITLLSILAVLPATSHARLPVVNINSGAVSARAAFGADTVRPAPVVTVTPVEKKRVVARTPASAMVAPEKTIARTADVGAPIASNISSNDILSPRRPSADLWAHGTDTSVAPLRMPTPDEFRIVRSDALLPEESLDSNPAVVATQSENVTPMSSIDAQIARLNELQSRVDADVRATTEVAKPVPQKIATVKPRPHTISRAPISSPDPVAIAPAPVKISQLVVPMDDVASDVVTRPVKTVESPRIAAVRNDMTNLSPTELRRAFRKTFLSENKHLSTFQIDSAFDVASDVTTTTGEFISRRDLSEGGGIRPLEIKIKFRNDDAALSRDNYNLLSEYAGIVLSNPTRAVQISIPQSVTTNNDARKLAARRLAIVEQVLRDAGVSEHRILPVLAPRDDNGFMLRMISNDQYETLSRQKRNAFGDTVKTKTYKSMTW